MLVPPQAAALRCSIPAAAVTCDVLRHPPQLRCAVAPAVQEERRYLWSVLKLAREIRRERAYVGYIVFVCVGLLKRCRPMVWEGDAMVEFARRFCSLGVSFLRRPLRGAGRVLLPSEQSIWTCAISSSVRRAPIE